MQYLFAISVDSSCAGMLLNIVPCTHVARWLDIWQQNLISSEHWIGHWEDSCCLPVQYVKSVRLLKYVKMLVPSYKMRHLSTLINQNISESHFRKLWQQLKISENHDETYQTLFEQPFQSLLLHLTPKLLAWSSEGCFWSCWIWNRSRQSLPDQSERNDHVNLLHRTEWLENHELSCMKWPRVRSDMSNTVLNTLWIWLGSPIEMVYDRPKY